MMTDKVQITQEYRMGITMYKGHKISLGHTCCELRFKNKNDSWVRLFEIDLLLGTQKTLSSTRPTYATVICPYKMDETGRIDLGDRFVLFDFENNTKVGKGQVLKVVRQS